MSEPRFNSTFLVGLLFALVAAAGFGASGPLAKGLLSAGWSANAAVTWRVSIGALLMLPFGLLALRGRWSTLRAGWKRIVMFGFVSVAAVASTTPCPLPSATKRRTRCCDGLGEGRRSPTEGSRCWWYRRPLAGGRVMRNCPYPAWGKGSSGARVSGRLRRGLCLVELGAGDQ